MRYTDPKLRDMLASEYALGTLHGPARRRFERILRMDADLRRQVAEWEERLAPLAQATPAVMPPARVWKGIERRIRKAPTTSGFWQNLAFWRALGAFSTAMAAALLLYVGLAPQPTAGPSYVAVLADSKAQPVMVVNFEGKANQLKVRVLNAQAIGADRSLELWSLPAGGAPQSLGLVPDSGEAQLTVARARSEGLPGVPALAVSLEPKGGSPTGAPTGPVLFSGPLLRL